MVTSWWPRWSTTVMTTTVANLFILDPPSDKERERANNGGLCTTYLKTVHFHGLTVLKKVSLRGTLFK